MKKRSIYQCGASREQSRAYLSFVRVKPVFFKYALSALLGCMALISCEKEDEFAREDSLTIDSGGIRFEMGFAPAMRVATGADFNSLWEAGDAVGIFATASGHPLQKSGNLLNNVKLAYDGTDWEFDEETTVVWPAGGALDFYAYYPYDENAADPTVIAFDVSTDQSGTTDGKPNYNRSDLLTAKAADVAKGHTVSLSFTHALAMVQVSVPGGKGWGASDNLRVYLCGVRTKSLLNLNYAGSTTAAVSPAATDNESRRITMHRVEQPGDANYGTSYTYRALVPAQTISKDVSLFQFEHEGRQLFQDGALTESFSLTANKAEIFNRSLPKGLHHTVEIPAAGKMFLMGSPLTEPGRNNSEIQHEVTLTKNFRMTKYEITNAQYAEFLNTVGVGQNSMWGEAELPDQLFIYEYSPYGLVWSANKWMPASGYENHPVVHVTWYGAHEYARWAGGSLPTEAQWEYACRGGQAESLPFGIGDGVKLIAGMANYFVKDSYQLPGGTFTDESGHASGYVGKTTEVGDYEYPNGYGLYDMHGNVWEWCLDWYAENYGIDDFSQTVTDPTGPESGSVRLIRGGAWETGAQLCRTAYRGSLLPNAHTNTTGFRVVFEK